MQPLNEEELRRLLKLVSIKINDLKMDTRPQTAKMIELENMWGMVAMYDSHPGIVRDAMQKAEAYLAARKNVIQPHRKH